MGDRLGIPGAGNFSNANFIFVMGTEYYVYVVLVSYMLVEGFLSDIL